MNPATGAGSTNDPRIKGISRTRHDAWKRLKKKPPFPHQLLLHSKYVSRNKMVFQQSSNHQLFLQKIIIWTNIFRSLNHVSYLAPDYFQHGDVYSSKLRRNSRRSCLILKRPLKILLNPKWISRIPYKPSSWISIHLCSSTKPPCSMSMKIKALPMIYIDIHHRETVLDDSLG